MTAPRIDQLLEKFNCNPPSTVAAISGIEATNGIRLPLEYRDFLLHANGGEGFVGPNAVSNTSRLFVTGTASCVKLDSGTLHSKAAR